MRYSPYYLLLKQLLLSFLDLQLLKDWMETSMQIRSLSIQQDISRIYIYTSEKKKNYSLLSLSLDKQCNLLVDKELYVHPLRKT